MKGKVLDFNLQLGQGVISGDNGERYNFTSAEWKSADIHPAHGVKVDFAIDEQNATGIYAEAAPVQQNTEANPTTAKLIYISFLVGLIVPFVSLIGVIFSYVSKGNGPEWLDENYRFQIRTFWIGALYFTVSFLLMFVLIGWITLIVSLVWYVIRTIKGLKALENKQAPANIDGWLF